MAKGLSGTRRLRRLKGIRGLRKLRGLRKPGGADEADSAEGDTPRPKGRYWKKYISKFSIIGGKW